MRDIRESEGGMNRRALSRPRRLKPVPATLSLDSGHGSKLPTKKARRRGRAFGAIGRRERGMAEAARRLASFISDGMRLLLVRNDILPLAFGEECWEFLDRLSRCD
jgi:hypothetical protein